MSDIETDDYETTVPAIRRFRAPPTDMLSQPARAFQVAVNTAGWPAGKSDTRTLVEKVRGFERPPTILVYHHLADKPDHLTDHLRVTTHPDTFRNHLKFCQKHFDLIGPSDLLSNKLPKRPLLITFDDAYRSVLDIGGPILRELSIESLFFLNPATITHDTLPLDNVLCLALHRLGAARLADILSLDVRRARSLTQLMFGFFANRSLKQREQARQAICIEMKISDRELKASSGLFLAADDLAAFPAYGIHVGNHTMTHPFLRHLTESELDTEIRVARKILQKLSGQRVEWFSTPYGDERDSSPGTVEAASSSGHVGLFLVQGRLNRYRPADNLLYRVSPRNVPSRLLPLSLSVLPFLRTLRKAAKSS